MQMKCYRKILHISYKDRVTNEEVRAKIQQAIGPHEDLHFCLYDPFKCISFHKFSRTTLLFLTLFFRSYLCLIGPFSLFSTALWNLANSRPVNSLMLSSHLLFCLPCLLHPFTIPCKMLPIFMQNHSGSDSVVSPPPFRDLWRQLVVKQVQLTKSQAYTPLGLLLTSLSPLGPISV